MNDPVFRNAANKRIVVARIGEDFTLKRLQIIQNRN